MAEGIIFMGLNNLPRAVLHDRSFMPRSEFFASDHACTAVQHWNTWAGGDGRALELTDLNCLRVAETTSNTRRPS